MNGALHSLRALTDKKATLEDLQRSLDEVRLSSQMLQTAKAELRDVDNIKIELNNAAMALDGLQVAKADQSSIDEAHREIAQVLDTKADRASLDDARHLLSRALETKADRFEITALTNYFISLLQTRVTKDEIAPLEESHYGSSNIRIPIEQPQRLPTASFGLPWKPCRPMRKGTSMRVCESLTWPSTRLSSPKLTVACSTMFGPNSLQHSQQH